MALIFPVSPVVENVRIFFVSMVKPDLQNILVVHVAGLAQTTLALPALKSLRRHLPDSRITVVTASESEDLLRLGSIADEILPIGRFKHVEMLNPVTLFRSAKIARGLRQNNYDIVIEFKSNTESGIILQFVNARSTLNRTSQPGGLGLLLSRIGTALFNTQPRLIHDAHGYLKKVEGLGVRPIESEPRISTDRASDEWMEKLLQKHSASIGELLVGIHPGAMAGMKQGWPVEKFASIASRMIHNFNALTIIFAGPNERGTAKKIAAMLPAKRAIAIESPKLADFASAAARLSLFIGGHSGPAHIAAAVGTPVLAISATSGPSPQDLLSKYHDHVRASHIDLISEEDVYESACRLIKTSRAEYLSARR